ncbi:sensor histidine kinase [Paenibacillus harenae]|uniref:sensor histidine kinase n=1 Tax=Paenibacillus harenae TaxID=306543 RepID=UPI002792B2AC|nr:histidine kinase [Paenibacillus harenae]MDQ0061112.1 two-component system nitrate/nitrite sensor histidine kinase NarQ [Paenibacillus harenae]
MSYKWLKRLILWIPTVTIGSWEYVRHAILLPYVSMELGNVLAPVLVFVVTLTLLRGLFAKLEQTQESLQQERVAKAAFEEREQLARELHDGISQSLFMLSVKLDRLERETSDPKAQAATQVIKSTVRRVHDDVRQQVESLHHTPLPSKQPWLQSIHHLTAEMEQTSGIRTTVEWNVKEDVFTPKQKVELLAIMREALMNVQKHARAGRVIVRGGQLRQSGFEDSIEAAFYCEIEDDGIGASSAQLNKQGTYGLKMMQARAEAMRWSLDVSQASPQGTIVTIRGRGTAK